MRFNINDLVVDYSTAMLDDFPNGQISDGDFVEAKGTNLGGELLASEVELEDFLPDANDGDRVEIEGFITRFASAEDFDVAGLPARISTGGDEGFEVVSPIRHVVASWKSSPWYAYVTPATCGQTEFPSMDSDGQ